MLTDDLRKKMLEPSRKPVKIVLDTDTKNEIDDQFAIAYALLSSEEIEVETISAAPFRNVERGYPDPESGMEASYQEILSVLEKMEAKGKVPVLKGSKTILKSADEPVNSEAATNLIQLAMKKRENPLYVVAIGAITNIISAILMKPAIMERIVVVWLGGQPTYWDTARDFNLQNDPIGSMAFFDSGVPLVWLPCKNVLEHLRTFPAEIEHYVRGRGNIGNYLADLFKSWTQGEAWSKVMWDIAGIAYLVNSEWIPTKLSPAPKLNVDNLRWSEVRTKRHICRSAVDLKRDPIFLDFFQKLEKFSK